LGLNTGLGAAPVAVIRDTPRESLQGFLDATHRRDFEVAAHYLHLWGIQPARQKAEGPELARKLAGALDRAVWIDIDEVPNTPTGTTSDGTSPVNDIQIAAIEVNRLSHTIRLSRTRDTYSNSMVWLFSANTVRSIDALDAVYGIPDYAKNLPAWLLEDKLLGLLGFQWLGLISLGLIGWLAGVVLEHPVQWVFRRVARRANTHSTNANSTNAARNDDTTVLSHKLVRWIVLPLVVLFSLPTLRLSATAAQQLNRVLIAGIILVATLGTLRLVQSSMTALQQRHAGHDDSLRVRSMVTRLDALRRIAHVLISIVGVALALMQFPTARTVGLSLLGSAGIAGAILGFAAQKTFSSLFAGILISFTQPMRIGDTVIVENEFGQIETIGSTHVVVRIWDSRRLVVPVTYFLDNPFQNWTKVSPELSGTVFLYADYSVDVHAVRAELDRILEGEPLHDGRAKAVYVTDVTDRAAQIRITVSARNAGDLFVLRCIVRESMLAYLHQKPSQLPQHRLQAPGLLEASSAG